MPAIQFCCAGSSNLPRCILDSPPPCRLYSRAGRLTVTVLHYLTQGRPWPKYLFYFWEYINGNPTFILDSHRPFICSVYMGTFTIAVSSAYYSLHFWVPLPLSADMSTIFLSYEYHAPFLFVSTIIFTSVDHSLHCGVPLYSVVSLPISSVVHTFIHGSYHTLPW